MHAPCSQGWEKTGEHYEHEMLIKQLQDIRL
jgi:hypothetical protein